MQDDSEDSALRQGLHSRLQPQSTPHIEEVKPPAWQTEFQVFQMQVNAQLQVHIKQMEQLMSTIVATQQVASASPAPSLAPTSPLPQGVQESPPTIASSREEREKVARATGAVPSQCADVSEGNSAFSGSRQRGQTEY